VVTNSRVDAWQLTDVVTRLRRVLRASIRSDYPWEALPMAQVEILQRLRDEPGLRVSDLAARHRLATNTVSTLIQQMVVTGLVARITDSADRRAVQLHLTKHGKAMLREWMAAHERRLEAAVNALRPADRAAIRNALPAIAHMIDEIERRDDAAASSAE